VSSALLAETPPALGQPSRPNIRKPGGMSGAGPNASGRRRGRKTRASAIQSMTLRRGGRPILWQRFGRKAVGSFAMLNRDIPRARVTSSARQAWRSNRSSHGPIELCHDPALIRNAGPSCCPTTAVARRYAAGRSKSAAKPEDQRRSSRKSSCRQSRCSHQPIEAGGSRLLLRSAFHADLLQPGNLVV
jgi:hypothetical protein